MAHTPFVVLIPARLASSRLPNKPLADLAGLPMVVRVAQRALLSKASQVVVAADDDSIIKAAQIDGASLPRIYWRVILPILRPVVFSTTLVLSHLSIKSFDLVMALTSGGPGYASDVPATFMYVMSFTRGQIGLGAASATMMLVFVAALVVPYLYSELRTKPHDR